MSDRVEQIRARAEAATEGPWVIDSTEPSIWSPRVIVIGNYTAADLYESPAWEDGTAEDLGFIAHAREDVPWLLAEVERLQRDVDHLRGIVRRALAESGEAIEGPTP